MPPPQDGRDTGQAPDLMALVNTGLLSQAVYVAAELGIADLLANGPKDASELARITGSHTPFMHRFLRALASLGLCVERDDGAFDLGATGLPLRSNARDSLRSWVIWNGRYMWPAWGRLHDSVKAGKSVQRLAGGGDDGFGRLTRDPQAAAAFNSAMVEITRLIADDVVCAYDFAATQRIVDIGGGHGALLAAILKTHPRMSGALFDLPHAVEGARAYLTSEGVADRCDVIAGDFFESIPAEAATYLLKNIIHDWNDERSIILLRNCRRAMPTDARLLIVEQMTPGRLEASPAHRTLAWTDLAMMVGQDGSQRTEAQFRSLLAASGFRVARTIDTALGYSIIEGVPQ